MVFRRHICFLFFLIITGHPLFCQPYESVSSYIESYGDIARRHMEEYGIPASIKLAQAILESGFGNSELAVNANNHFGIKCHGWGYATYYKDDDKRNECFRSYLSPVHSFEDHSEFLSTRPRYSFLFDLDPLNYKGWARGLREAGYATNPDYSQLLIRIIEEHKLYYFDQKVINGDLVAAGLPRSKKDHRHEAVDLYREREIRINNRIKYVYAHKGDTPESVAEEMQMWAWQLYRYNELDENSSFEKGDIVYLQPKRRRGEGNYHIVKQGETMYDISQLHGIRLEHLYRRNNMEPGTNIVPGQKIVLRGRVSD